ncbi:MAG: glycoside hydrolase family 2 TIM barrel-domain containing protein [Eubacteriales bacterium]
MSNRIVSVLKDNWLFSREFNHNSSEIAENCYKKDFDDSSWKRVTVPHDWAVEGPFSPDNDPQYVKVHADGVLKETAHIGRTGGLPITGLGVYRRNFTITPDSKRVFLEFDGVMSYSEVYVNGINVGGRPYGYSSFSLDISEVVMKTEENTLLVLANPKETSSRWYTGAGIYRPVRLVELQETFITFNGTYITSKVTKENTAKIVIQSDFSGEINESYQVEEEIFAPNGMSISKKVSPLSSKVTTEVIIQNPQLWDVISPVMYQCVIQIIKNGTVIDQYTSKFGIRTVEISRENGFVLNQKKMKLQGVCLHHDLGMIGAETNVYAIKRQLEMLKTMGCNAIRCTHNPFSREFMDLCDEMGFLVIPEAFDEWKVPKVPNGYTLLFDEWAERDLIDLIRRDRNHPSVIMWSLGNEIRDQNEEEGVLTAKFLCDISHREDPTRPTTFGINNPTKAIELGFCDVVDVVGFNYQGNNYEKYLKEHPNWIILGSETASTVSSRGVYHFPPESDFPVAPHPSGYISSYDLSGPNWAYVPEKEFAAQDQFPNLLGEFVWTGFDYLGEPTPFRNQWPSHVSYFGIIDMAGIPKDRFYSYQSKWSKKPVLHLFPHWNWEEHQKISVHAYSNCHKIELFLNQKSLGFATKDSSIILTENSEKCAEVKRFRFIWHDVTYESGELKAVGYDIDGNFITTDVIHTARNPEKIVVIPEKTILEVGELAYVRVKVTDIDGNLCPNADDLVHFSVSGVGEYVAADSGDQCSTRTFSEPYCPVFHGECVFCLRTLKEGIVSVVAEGDNLQKCKIFLDVRS